MKQVRVWGVHYIFCSMLLACNAAAMLLQQPTAVSQKLSPGITQTGSLGARSIEQAKTDAHLGTALTELCDSPAMRVQIDQAIQNQKKVLSSAGVNDPQVQEALMIQTSHKCLEGLFSRFGHIKEVLMLEESWKVLKSWASPMIPYLNSAIACLILAYIVIGSLPGVGPALQHVLFGNGILSNVFPWRWSVWPWQWGRSDATFLQRLVGGY